MSLSANKHFGKIMIGGAAFLLAQFYAAYVNFNNNLTVPDGNTIEAAELNKDLNINQQAVLSLGLLGYTVSDITCFVLKETGNFPGQKPRLG